MFYRINFFLSPSSAIVSISPLTPVDLRCSIEEKERGFTFKTFLKGGRASALSLQDFLIQALVKGRLGGTLSTSPFLPGNFCEA